MTPAALPSNENERLARLRGLNVLDSKAQEAFDDITQLAAAICGTPIALLSLVDEGRQWFKARVGLEVAQTGRDFALCAHAILAPGQIMEVPDALQDTRFHDNPLVVGEPGIRFYAGAPIVTAEGLALGTVCVIDTEARTLTDVQRRSLQSLSRQVMYLLEQESERFIDASLQAMPNQGETAYLTALSKTSLELKSYVDKDYVYRFVNDTHLTYWARERSDVINKPVSEVMGESQFQQTVKPRLDQALDGHVLSYRALIDFPGKGKRHVEVSYLPSKDENGVVVGVVARIIDIEPLVRKESQLRDTISMLEQKTMEQERFIQVVSHDLREPINTINNFSALISEDADAVLSDSAKRYLALVRSGGQRMAILLDDLSKYLRLERPDLDLRPVDLSDLAMQVREDLTAAIERVDGRLEFGHLPITMGDVSLLRVLVQNLVANGLKFHRDGVPPRIVILASHTPESTLIQVTDNGIGIPGNQLENIFEAFRRLNLRRKFDGSGLGLSICQRIASLHGGVISAKSEEGKGSCFTLALPRWQPAMNERAGDEYL